MTIGELAMQVIRERELADRNASWGEFLARDQALVTAEIAHNLRTNLFGDWDALAAPGERVSLAAQQNFANAMGLAGYGNGIDRDQVELQKLTKENERLRSECAMLRAELDHTKWQTRNEPPVVAVEPEAKPAMPARALNHRTVKIGMRAP